MKFRGSFCDPFKKDIIELGDIPTDKVAETFEKISWKTFLEKMQSNPGEEIFYSPSLEIENKDNRHGLAISAVGEPGNFEFYIFYKRPKHVKRLFGLIESRNENYLTDVTGQGKNDVLECLNALLKNDLEFLDRKIK